MHFALCVRKQEPMVESTFPSLKKFELSNFCNINTTSNIFGFTHHLPAMSRFINCNFKKKVHSIFRKRSMLKRPSTILRIAHLIVASNAYPSSEPGAASSQDLVPMVNAGKPADPSRKSPIASEKKLKKYIIKHF